MIKRPASWLLLPAAVLAVAGCQATAANPSAPDSAATSPRATHPDQTTSPQQSATAVPASSTSASRTSPSAAATSGTPASSAGAGSASSTAQATASASSCGAADANEAFQQATPKVPSLHPSDPMYDWQVADVPQTYDACSDLSAVIITIRGGTAGSPWKIMLFHRGRYLGTDMDRPAPAMPLLKRQSPAVIEATYRYARPGDTTATPTGSALSVFTWDAAQGQLIHTGDFPPA